MRHSLHKPGRGPQTPQRQPQPGDSLILRKPWRRSLIRKLRKAHRNCGAILGLLRRNAKTRNRTVPLRTGYRPNRNDKQEK